MADPTTSHHGAHPHRNATMTVNGTPTNGPAAVAAAAAAAGLKSPPPLIVGEGGDVGLAAAAPFFESKLTALLHAAGVLTSGAHTTLLACVAPGAAAKATSLATLGAASNAVRARLAPPSPPPRGASTPSLGSSESS